MLELATIRNPFRFKKSLKSIPKLDTYCKNLKFCCFWADLTINCCFQRMKSGFIVFGLFFDIYGIYFFWPLKSTFILLPNHFLAPVIPNLKVTRLNLGSRLPFLGDRKLHSQHTAPPTKIQISRILLPLMPMH